MLEFVISGNLERAISILQFRVSNFEICNVRICKLRIWNLLELQPSHLQCSHLQSWNLKSGIWNSDHGFIISRKKVYRMNYKRFEELPVWNDAIELAVQIYAVTSQPQFKSHYSLKDQIERAAGSVSNNIAEGFERGTNNDLLNFLYIARGSSGEVRSMLYLLDRLPRFQSVASEIPQLRNRAEACSRQLKAWSQSLQNSDFRGERYVNRRTRRREQAAREREEFLKELAEIRSRSAKVEKPNA